MIVTVLLRMKQRLKIKSVSNPNHHHKETNDNSIEDKDIGETFNAFF
jgi:hypothetical protein